MEPESPSPYPQVPATCPYPEPIPCSPHNPLQMYYIYVTFSVSLAMFWSICSGIKYSYNENNKEPTFWKKSFGY